MEKETTTDPAAPTQDTTNGKTAAPDTDTDVSNPTAQKFAKEAGEWRTKYRALEQKLSELETKLAADPTGGNSDSKGELAALQRKFNDIESKWKAAEEKSTAAEAKIKAKTLHAALSSLAASAQLTDTETAIELLHKRAKIAADDAVVFTVTKDGKETEIEATVENLKKHGLLPAIYFPAEGVAGSGAKPSARVTATAVDLSKAGDFAYFKQNYAAIQAARKASRKA